jgi:peptide/nickel transport system substrate-binding protein
LSFDAEQLQYATCAKLLNYPDKPAPDGTRLEPEIARAMPLVSADGRTYTFTFRRDYRFSPPSGAPVTAATFAYSVERALDHRAPSHKTVIYYLRDVVGAVAYSRGKARHIAGVTARGNRVTFRLTQPDGGFFTRLAMPFFCPVPTNTPIDAKGMRIASAGPYYVAVSTPRTLVLERNPNYAGSRPRRASEIVYTAGSQVRAPERVLTGQIDYAPVSARDAARLHRLYPKQLFVNAGPWVDSFVFNTSRPPFSDAKLRRAVNFAIDRRALAAEGGFFVGYGPYSMVPTDQYLPSVLPGYKDVSIYPFTPDVARARRLAGNRHRRVVLYTCTKSPCPQEAEILKRNLAPIGITLDAREFSMPTLGHRLDRRGEPYDMAIHTWGVEYPDPYLALNFLLDGNVARRGEGVDFAHFDDPTYNHRLEAAAQLRGAARDRAYARLDADLARDAAPFASFGNETIRDFFSPRIGCQLFQPNYGIDLAALCVRG